MTARASTIDIPRPGGNAARTGHRNPNARLTPEAVAWVREVHGQGRTISEMARELGVHRSTVADVVRGVSWRDGQPLAREGRQDRNLS